jgi:hypothetical protein
MQKDACQVIRKGIKASEAIADRVKQALGIKPEAG